MNRAALDKRLEYSMNQQVRTWLAISPQAVNLYPM